MVLVIVQNGHLDEAQRLAKIGPLLEKYPALIRYIEATGCDK